MRAKFFGKMVMETGPAPVRPLPVVVWLRVPSVCRLAAGPVRAMASGRVPWCVRQAVAVAFLPLPRVVRSPGGVADAVVGVGVVAAAAFLHGVEDRSPEGDVVLLEALPGQRDLAWLVEAEAHHHQGGADVVADDGGIGHR